VANVEWIASALSISEDRGTDVDEILVEGLRSRKIGNRTTPISDHIFKLSPVFDDHFGDHTEYAEAFGQAEVFMDLMGTDAGRENRGRHRGGQGACPLGITSCLMM
jgi:hypothetical protein